METEIWKDIPWYEWKYQASNLWNIRIFNYRRILWKIVIAKLNFNKKIWYFYIKFCKNWKYKDFRVHRLVAQTFIPNPENKLQINHKNWIKTDNRVENLEWCTNSENIIHSYRILKTKPTYLWKFWKDHNCSIKINQYDLNWNFIKTWDSFMSVNRELKLNTWSLWLCCNWKRWVKKVWNFIWKYN